MVSHSVSLQSVHWQAFWWNSWSIGPWFAQGMDDSIPNSSEVLALAWTTYCAILYLLSPLEHLRALLHIHWTFTIVTFFIFRMPFQSGTSKIRGSSERPRCQEYLRQHGRSTLRLLGNKVPLPRGSFTPGCPKVLRQELQKTPGLRSKHWYYMILPRLVVLMVRICSNALAVLVTSSRKHNPWFGMFWQNDSPSRNGVSWGWKSCCSNGGINSSWPWPKGCFMLPPCSATCFFFFLTEVPLEVST